MVENNHSSVTVSGLSAVVTLPPELSGCAVVDGGVLIVEDEAIGSVLLARDVTARPLSLVSVKLERKKTEDESGARKPKLFPIQDMEDIATDRKTRVYIIGSHNGKGGGRRPDREFLLRALWDKKDGELKVDGECYGLLAQMAPVLKRVGCDIDLAETKISDTLYIEGIGLHEDALYIGLRSPLTPDGQAILVVGKADDFFEAGKKPALDAVALDLDGGGIRALDWDPKREKLLLLSGAALDRGKARPTLWQCDIDGENLEQLLLFDEAIARKHPEGVCRLPSGQLLIVLDGEDQATGSEVVFLED